MVGVYGRKSIKWIHKTDEEEKKTTLSKSGLGMKEIGAAHWGALLWENGCWVLTR